jgi:hypothetical protein
MANTQIEAAFTIDGKEHTVAVPVEGSSLQHVVEACAKFAAQSNALITGLMDASESADPPEEEGDGEDAADESC